MGEAALVDRQFEVSDVSGQKVVTISRIPIDTTVNDVVQQVVPELRLPMNDGEGHPLAYHLRLDREGRHLLGSERVSDAVQTGDRVVLQPNVDAGGTWGPMRVL